MTRSARDTSDPVERIAYTPAEVAKAFGLSRKAIYRAISSGELRAARVCSGSRLLVTVEEAHAWVARNLATSESVPAAPASRAARRDTARTPLKDALRQVA